MMQHQFHNQPNPQQQKQQYHHYNEDSSLMQESSSVSYNNKPKLQKQHKSNQDMPLSGVAQTLQNFLQLNTSLSHNPVITSTDRINPNSSASQQVRSSINHQTANFNSVAQFNPIGSPEITYPLEAQYLMEEPGQDDNYEGEDEVYQNTIPSQQPTLPRSQSLTYTGSFGQIPNSKAAKFPAPLHSQGERANISSNLYNKQVRFSIKNGLKNIINDSNLEIESIASRGNSINQAATTGQNANSQSHRVTSVDARNKRGQDQERKKSKSPSVGRRGRSQSQGEEDNKRKVSKNSKQLAMKYKREAEESRRKKAGEIPIEGNFINDLSSIPGNQTPQTRNSFSPNKSAPISQSQQQNYQLGQIQSQLTQKPSQDSLDIQLPRQMNQNHFQQNSTNILIQQPYILPSSLFSKPKPVQIESQKIGTIMKRDALSHSRERIEQIAQSFDNYQQVQVNPPKLAGRIVRRRSLSPADVMQLKGIININKENQSYQINQIQLTEQSTGAGQIYRQQTSKANLIQGSENYTKIISPEQNKQPIQQQSYPISPQRNLNSPLQIQNQSISFLHSAQQQAITKPQSLEPVIFKMFKNIWATLSLQQEEVKVVFADNRSLISNQRYDLLTSLSKQPHFSPFFNNSVLFQTQNTKLEALRRILPSLFQETFEDDINLIIKMRDQRRAKQLQLQAALKQFDHANQKLKIELLKDIIARLSQKLVIRCLELNQKIRIQMKAQFDAYYSEFIAKDKLRAAFSMLNQFRIKNRDKTLYLQAVKQNLYQVKKNQCFQAWKHIKDFVKTKQDQLSKFNSILLSRKMTRLVNLWKIVIIQSRNKNLGLQIAEQHHKMKIFEELFLRWIYQHRSSNKIKRRALMMISPSQREKLQKKNGYDFLTLSDEEWLKQKLVSLKERFNQRIQEMMLEREHNRAFIKGLQFKISKREIDSIFPLRENMKSHAQSSQDYTGAQKSNQVKIYKHHPELRFKSKSPVREAQNSSFRPLSSEKGRVDRSQDLRRSQDVPLDLDIKFSIHSALVHHQNTQKLLHIHHESYTVEKISPKKEIKLSKLMPPPPRRLIELETENQKALQNQNHVPNQLFKKLQDQVIQQQSLSNNSTFVSGSPLKDNRDQDYHFQVPLDLQLRAHIKKLQSLISVLSQNSYDHHFGKSLNSLSRHQSSSQSQEQPIVPGEQYQNENAGLRDYIYYGISQDQYRMVFLRLFKTKALSVLFNQWKHRYLKRQLDHDLESLHVIKSSQQQFIEWNRVVKGRKIKAKEQWRVGLLKKRFRIFIGWVKWQSQKTKEDRQIVKEFKQRNIFRAWINYLDGQGQNLMKILKAQSYYKQALLSKSLVSLYKNYLRELRVRRFQRKIYFSKFFNQKWRLLYLRLNKLRKLTQDINDKVSLNERLKYQREFDVKREVLQVWSHKVYKEKQLLRKLTALTHYKQTLVCKSFIGLKKNQHWGQGARLLRDTVLSSIIQPTFQLLRVSTQQQKKTEVDFLNYRMNYLKAVVFNLFRQNTVEARLSKLFMKKKVFKAWQNINCMKNHQLPAEYREQRLKQVFFLLMKQLLQQRWAQQRSQIIERNLHKQRALKLKKQIFVALLENILLQKRARIVTQTVREFRDHNLKLKSYKALKTTWVKEERDRITERVAREFYSKLLKRRELKRKQYWEDKGVEYGGEDEITKGRVFNAWRLYTEHKLTKDTVLRRYKDFKRRFLSLRVFLAWRSVAKYEQTPTQSLQTSNQTTSKRSAQKIAAHPNKVYQGYQLEMADDSILKNKDGNSIWTSTPSHHHLQGNRTSNLPLQIASPNFNNDDLNQGISRSTKNNQPQIQMNNFDQRRDLPIGDPDLTQIRAHFDETPMKNQRIGTSGQRDQDKSLFDELENIFQKNRKWLDEQKEREDFLREMAQHYNQRISQEMNTLRSNSLAYSTLNQYNQPERDYQRGAGYASITSVNQ